MSLYIRIVGSAETTEAVMREAIKKACQIWCNPAKGQAVIAKHSPGNDFEKMSVGVKSTS